MATMVISTQHKKTAFPFLPVILAVFVLVYAGLGIVWMRGNYDSNDLNQQIEYNQTQLSKPKDFSPLKDLKIDLATAEADVVSISNRLYSGTLHNIDATNQLAVIAESSGDVEITAISRAQSDSRETFSGGQYVITATGQPNDLMNLVANMAKARQILAGAKIESLRLSSSEDTGELSEMLLVLNITDHLTGTNIHDDVSPENSFALGVAANQ